MQNDKVKFRNFFLEKPFMAGMFFCLVMFLSLPFVADATDWYVSKNGNNLDGSSWATAWNELNQIYWPLVQAGDTINLDGSEDSMRYSTGLVVGSAGSEMARINIVRSEEQGHNGIVYLSSTIYVDQPYVTIDGKNNEKLVVDYAGTGYIVRNPGNGNYFEFKNVFVDTQYKEETLWGTPFYSNSANVLVSGCRFDDTNKEDQIKYNGTNGKMTIENSLFSGLTGHGEIHEDIVQIDTSGASLLVRRNFFMGDRTDCFMINSGQKLGILEFYYNVFSKNSDAIKAHSAESLKAYNNVFDSCRDIIISDTPIDSKNNIYSGISVWEGPIHLHQSTYSINDIGTEYWIPGTGNLLIDPLFVNKIGLDYSLQSGSPAIDAGVDVGMATDILGNAIVGAPDVGAYEYVNPLQADFDSDSDVDIFDYNILLANFGTTGDCDNPADADGDCNVGIFDYNILLEEFGSGT